MTREEAIKVLNTYDVNFDEYTAEEIADAIDMAIEALQAEYEDYEHATLVDIKEPLKVSVVRCKDCRFYSNDHLCEQLSRFGSIEPLADFYCAFGERREP